MLMLRGAVRLFEKSIVVGLHNPKANVETQKVIIKPEQKEKAGSEKALESSRMCVGHVWTVMHP